jgi:hypothetical protein
VYSPAGLVPLPSHLTSCTPLKSKFYLDSFPETVIREPVLYKLLTLHNPNLMSVFHCLGRLLRKSIQVQGSLMTFITNLFFTVKGSQPHAKLPSWRTTPCRLSVAVYSIYSQLPSIAGGHTSIRNLRTCHAVVTGKPRNMAR